MHSTYQTNRRVYKLKKELILCFNKEQALALNEIANGDAGTFLELSGQLDKYYIPRYVAETSSELIHPIPYFMVQNEKGDILLYQRGKGVGESRLAGNHSIGFGGHVELEKDGIGGYFDLLNIAECIESAFINELNEELTFTCYKRTDYYTKIIYDSTDEVGKVHLGIAGVVVVKSATINEPELIDCGWHSKQQLIDMQATGEINLENWSKILLDML